MTAAQQRIAALVVSVVAVAVLIVFFGWVFPTQYTATDTRLVAQAFYIGIAAMGLNVLTGYNGQVSIGHGAFFGVGAYTTALLMDHEYTWFGVTFGHMSFIGTLPISAAVCFVVGALVGFPALHVKGLYLALVTLGLAVIFPDLANPLREGHGRHEPGRADAGELAAPSWFAERFPTAAQDSGRTTTRSPSRSSAARRVGHRASRFGRSLIAVRDHEAAAASVGIDLAAHEGAGVRA